MPYYNDPEDARRRRAEVETYKDLRSEFFQDSKASYFAMLAYQELNAALDLVESKHEKIGRKEFLTQCDFIHANVEYYLNSRAFALSDVAIGGIFTDHKVLRLEEGYRDPKSLDFRMDMSRGNHLWKFQYISFYKILFEEVPSYERFEGDQINKTTLSRIIENYDLFYHIETEKRLSLEDFTQNPLYRSVTDASTLAGKYEEVIGGEEKAKLSDEELHVLMMEKHEEWQHYRDESIDKLTILRFQTIANGLHHVDIAPYETTGIYQNCKHLGLLEEPDIEKKICIAFVMQFRYSRTHLYKSPYDLPFNKILRYAQRIGQVTMPKEEMTPEERERAEQREEYGRYLERALLNNKSFLEKFMQG